MTEKKNTNVYFVGAGPGDPKLLTVRAAELLKETEVVIYDRLVNKEILKIANPKAKLVYVGKIPNGPTVTQEEINELIVYYGKKNSHVVRLKGGDPAVFGRVGEEALFVRQHSLSYEMVPGVTAGIAAPLYAGIPLTHIDYSASFAVVTGHKKKEDMHHPIDWKSLAKSVDTLVFYMGIAQIETIQKELLGNGLKPSTPVALIRLGTYPEQEVLAGELESITANVKASNFKSPAIIVVGEVVRLHDQLAWYGTK